MTATLTDLTDTENAAKKTYDELIKAKTDEVDALTASIEDKIKRLGDLGVKIVAMKEDLSDAEESLLEDKKFLGDLDKNCATQEKEWAESSKTRQEELLALADTIKILNDDDALELFKKTLPGASSLLQLTARGRNMKSQALQLLEDIKSNNPSDKHRLDFIMLENP